MGRQQRRQARRHQRLLGQMDRASRRMARRHVRRSGDRALLGLAVVVAAAVGAGVALDAAGVDLAGAVRPRAYIEVDGHEIAVPRPVPSDGRLLPAVPVVTEGAHAFLHTTADGGPVGYDPCRPVDYVTREQGAPGPGARLVSDAMAMVSAASGLVFSSAGTTDEAPALDRVLIQPERYGEGWAPLLIAWSDEGEMPELAGQVAGVGGSAAVPGSDGTGTWLAAGRVVLDYAEISALLAEPLGEERAKAIVAHELAHVLGLDHVDDTTELMHPVTAARTDLGPGDLQGLALVGQVPCET